MKLIKAEITGFGQYRQQTFDFLPKNQLFFGKNEAGKSTLYQFIQVMLFGFPKKSKHKRDFMPQDGSSYGGKLWLTKEPYGEIVIERYRQVNKGKAKVWMNGQAGEESLLSQLLAPLTLENFQEVFTFQQEQLSQVDRLQEEKLHVALLSIGLTGSKQWLTKTAEYRKQNDKIYRPQARRLPLNQSLQAWQQLKEKIQLKESQEAQVQQAYQQRSSYSETEQQLKVELDQIQKKILKIQQQKNYWPQYQEWETLQQRKVMAIKLDEKQQLQQFYQGYQHLTDDIQKIEMDLAQLEQGPESDRYIFYIDQEANIQALLRQSVDMTRLVDEQERVTEELAVRQRKIAELSEIWGWQPQQPPVELDARIPGLMQRLATIQQTIHQREPRVQWLQEKMQPIEADLTQLENRYPELINKETTSRQLPLLSVFLGGLALLVSFFLSGMMKNLGLSLGVVLLVAGCYLFWRSQKQHAPQVKAMWQEKLQQLDAYAEDLAQETASLQTLQKEKQQLVRSLQPFFGNTTDEQQWPKLLEDYQLARKEFQESRRQYQVAEEQMKDISQRVDEYGQKMAVYQEWLPLGNKSITEKLQVLTEFSDKMQAIKMSRLQQPGTLLAQQLKRVKAERGELFTENRALLTKFGLEQPTEIPLWMKQWDEQQKQSEREKELARLLATIFPDKTSQEQLEQNLRIFQEERNQLQQQRTAVVEERQRIELQLEQLQVDGILDELYQEESRLLSEIQDLALTWSRNQVLVTALNDLATELSEQQLPQLLEKTSVYFQILTNKRYGEVCFSEGHLHVMKNQAFWDVYELSTGTKDQLIMAVRFAYLSLQGQASICPVIIDDGWLHYDSERKAQLAKLLMAFSKENQVICLSSDKEMVSYYQRDDQPVIEMK